MVGIPAVAMGMLAVSGLGGMRFHTDNSVPEPFTTAS
jgi:hypothetical protein